MTKSTRFAAVGAAAALGAAALVGATTTTAQAAAVTNSYSCSNSTFGLGPWTVGLVSDAPILDNFTTIGAGFDVTAGLVELTNIFTIPKSARDTMVGAGVEDVAITDFAGSFGDSAVNVLGMTAKVSEMTDNGNDTYSFSSNGANGAFEVPAAGTYPVVSPESFTLLATMGANQIPVSCTLTPDTTAGTYTSIEVVKNASASSGTAVKKTLKTTKVAKMKAVVNTNGAQIATGKVLVKKGKKTLGSAMLNDAGKATVKMGKLKKGKHTVKVVYKGDGYTLKSSSEKIVFTIKKP